MSRLPDLCDRVITWGLVALIAFTPFAFGTVESWSIAIMEWGIVSLLLVLGLRRLWPGGEPGPQGSGRTGLEIPIALFIVFCALQTAPMPPRWLEKISPGSARLYQAVDFKAWAETVHPGSTRDRAEDPLLQMRAPEVRPVSVRPRETWVKIRLVAALAGLVFLVVGWADRGQRIVFLIGSVTVIGFLIALQGLVQFLTWNGKIYWIRAGRFSSAFGPFVNHNHFAGYVEMVIPVAISLAFHLIEARRNPPEIPDDPSDRSWLQGAARGAVDETGRLGRGVLSLFAAIILVVSLFFCLSRGGILSAVVSGLVLFALLWRRLASRRPAWSIALMLPVLVVVLISWIGAGTVAQRITSYQTVGHEASFRYRLMVWSDLIHHVPEFLWAGSGLGTFEESFAWATPPGSSARWDKAHNDYLQLLWETGVVGVALFLAGTWAFVRRYWWPAIHGRAHALDLFRVGVAVSLLSIALHSLVDFNLQIGANGFLFALLLGLLIALHREVDRKGSDDALSAQRNPTRPRVAIAGRQRRSYIPSRSQFLAG